MQRFWLSSSCITPDPFSALYQSKYLNSHIMPAPSALCFMKEGDYWNNFFLSGLQCCILQGIEMGRTRYLQRAWKALMSPLPLPRGSTGLWPLLAPRKTKSFLELVISSWRRAGAKWRTLDSRNEITTYDMWFHCVTFEALISSFLALCEIKAVVLSFIKIDAFGIYFYPYEPSGYCRSYDVIVGNDILAWG